MPQQGDQQLGSWVFFVLAIAPVFMIVFSLLPKTGKERVREALLYPARSQSPLAKCLRWFFLLGTLGYIACRLLFGRNKLW